MSEDAVRRMRAMLRSAQALSRSDNLFARVSGERIAVILVDALLELDTGLDDPWDELPGAFPGGGG